jgi:hypothetical protein
MEIKMINPDKPVVVSSTRNTKPAFTEEITTPAPKMTNKFVLPISFILVIALGAYSGAMLKSSMATKGGAVSPELSGIQADIPESGVKVGDIFGSANEKSFNTSATGVIDKGGINGEGTHKLVRPGGISQTAYLTSSVIDLDSLVGHQVTVWGETFKGQKAGWLMDVGRAKVETLNAPLPK